MAIICKKMSDNKRTLQNRATKKHLIISIIVVAFMLITAILSHFFDQYEIVHKLLGGKRLIRFWLVIIVILLGAAGVERLMARQKRENRR